MAVFYHHVLSHSDACTHRTIRLNNSDSEPVPAQTTLCTGTSTECTVQCTLTYRCQFGVHYCTCVSTMYTNVPVPVQCTLTYRCQFGVN